MTDQTSEASASATAELDCTETVRRLYDFLDGELTEERRRKIRLHLDHCGPCEEVFEFEVELRRVIADRCKDHVPDQLRRRIAEAIDHERLNPTG
jgi:mycothiol system anti-sigma-R factor